MGRSVHRRAFIVSAVVLAAVLLVGSPAGARPRGASKPRPVPPTIGFAPGAAEAADGSVPPVTAAGVCGSARETYLEELLHTAPTAVQVNKEWSDVVPGGRQLMVSGVVKTASIGTGDLPMSHPFGSDLSMNVDLDQPFRQYSLQLGSEPGEEQPGWLHMEITGGFIPHARSAVPATPSPNQTWDDVSAQNRVGILPGFDEPAVGDRVAIMGHWIIDCGHGDYAAELHPMSFLAWSHLDGARNVVHMYANPYRDTELYSPDASILGNVNDGSRLTRPDTKTFVPYFVDEVVRLLTGQADRLRSQELISAPRALPAPWRVCVPPGSRRGELRVRYDLVTRPGVDVEVHKDERSGCATVEARLRRDYRAPDVALRSCALPWMTLDRLAGEAVGSPVDVRSIIKGYVPAAAWPLVDRDPVTSCGDALTAPNVEAHPHERDVHVRARQPFPFYGVVTVERGRGR